MRLNQFIENNIEEVLLEWESFLRTTMPVAQNMTDIALKDHSREILKAIAKDMTTEQTDKESYKKSQGFSDGGETAAATHGVLRQLVGFDLIQLAAEYRAMRATVLRMWKKTINESNDLMIEDITRFNEGVDQALAQSIHSYSERVAHSRDTFLAVLGHDLRSPLMAVSMTLATLKKKDLSADSKIHSLEIAQRGVKAMNVMINDILQYSKSRLGKPIEVSLKNGDISILCQQVIDESQAAHPKRKFILNMSGDCNISFDNAKMRQVLTNLLNNADQYGDINAPVELILDCKKELYISVRNMGQPISPDAIQVIFDPLVQIQSKQQPLSNSLGLGLFIAQEIVAAHKGKITVTSSESEGTTFTVIIPRKID